jgi:hypothetical protein
VLFCPIAALGSGAFPGDVGPPGLDIRWSVGRPGTCSLSTGGPRARLLGAHECLELGYEVGL